MNMFRCFVCLLFLMLCFTGCSEAGDRSASDAAYAQKFILDATNSLLSWDVLHPDKSYSPEHFEDKLRVIYNTRTSRTWSIDSLLVSSEQKGLKGIVIVSKVTTEAEVIWVVSKVNETGRPEVFLTSESPSESVLEKFSELSL